MAVNQLPRRDICPAPVIPSPGERQRMMEGMQFAPGLGMSNIVMDTLIMSRAPSTMIITVPTTPVLLAQPPHSTPYLISNPTLGATEGTTSIVLVNTTVSAAGDTQAVPMSVGNFLQCHFHLDVTAVTGSWDIIAQTMDPYTLRWADSQTLFSSINATGTYYGNIGAFGLVTYVAIRWVPVAAGSMTFSLTGTLKEGVSIAGGLLNTVFIGGREVTVNTGIPIFEGRDKVVYPGPDVELWAVAYKNINIKIFRL